jgi:cell division protein FtsI/penicillin-binding protein 2
LEPKLQQACDRLLELAHPVEGAIVALHLPSGRVLAWAERRGRSGKPVVTSARAPSASVLKIVTTAALLERGQVSPADRVCISGGLRAIERRHLEPARGGDVACDRFGQALGHSRNAAFAQLVTRHLLRHDLIEFAERFGFNHDAPFDVAVPVGKIDVPYGDLEFARTATGFENSVLSPVGGAHLAAVVAGGGMARRFHLVEQAGDYLASSEPEVVGRVIGARTAYLLTRMMEVTVHSGTALEAFTDERGRTFFGALRVAGKTGTLQPRPTAPTASWFVGFAPSRRPELALAVLLQNGRLWRRQAKEVGRDVLRSYFSGRGFRSVTAPFPS